MLDGCSRGTTEQVTKQVSCTHILAYHPQMVEDIGRLTPVSMIRNTREYSKPCKQIVGATAYYMQIVNTRYEKKMT